MADNGLTMRGGMRKRLENILYTELANANVGVRTWKRNGSGMAYFELGVVDVPRPKSPYLLGVAIHEIGHIHCYRTIGKYNEMHPYMMEYMAEIYTMEKLKKYGLPTREYKASAVKYVLSCLARYKNNGGDMNLVPADVRKWTGISIRLWKNAHRVLVDMDVDVHTMKEIAIYYKFDREN
jgi:hypothetical protein